MAADDKKKKIIKLESADEQRFEVEMEIAVSSVTIKNMIEGTLLTISWLFFSRFFFV